jgi:hypothetical protein
MLLIDLNLDPEAQFFDDVEDAYTVEIFAPAQAISQDKNLFIDEEPQQTAPSKAADQCYQYVNDFTSQKRGMKRKHEEFNVGIAQKHQRPNDSAKNPHGSSDCSHAMSTQQDEATASNLCALFMVEHIVKHEDVHITEAISDMGRGTDTYKVHNEQVTSTNRVCLTSKSHSHVIVTPDNMHDHVSEYNSKTVLRQYCVEKKWRRVPKYQFSEDESEGNVVACYIGHGFETNEATDKSKVIAVSLSALRMIEQILRKEDISITTKSSIKWKTTDSFKLTVLTSENLHVISLRNSINVLDNICRSMQCKLKFSKSSQGHCCYVTGYPSQVAMSRKLSAQKMCQSIVLADGPFEISSSLING